MRQPVRIVVDSRASIGLETQLVRTAGLYRTIVAHTADADAGRLQALEDAGVELLACRAKEGRVDVSGLLEEIGKRGIDSVLLEGGGELNASFMEERLVDEVRAFIAPKIVGGRDAKTPVEGRGFARMPDALEFTDCRMEQVGTDFLFSGFLQR